MRPFGIRHTAYNTPHAACNMHISNLQHSALQRWPRLFGRLSAPPSGEVLRLSCVFFASALSLRIPSRTPSYNPACLPCTSLHVRVCAQERQARTLVRGLDQRYPCAGAVAGDRRCRYNMQQRHVAVCMPHPAIHGYGRSFQVGMHSKAGCYKRIRPTVTSGLGRRL